MGLSQPSCWTILLVRCFDDDVKSIEIIEIQHFQTPKKSECRIYSYIYICIHNYIPIKFESNYIKCIQLYNYLITHIIYTYIIIISN